MNLLLVLVALAVGGFLALSPRLRRSKAWSTDVLQIISLASRAFAAFYALQCGVAAATALSRPDGRRRPLFAAVAALLGLLCVAVTAFGIPVE